MSYNIDTFKLKKLSLTLPKGFSIAEFEPDREWRGEIVVKPNGEFAYNDTGEGLSFKGVAAENGSLVVTDLNCSGEFSGTDYENLLKDLICEFSGEIECVTVWEGGDSILSLKIKDGEEEETEIEL